MRRLLGPQINQNVSVASATPEPHQDLSILVVDNNSVNQRIMERMLEKSGLQCVVAKDGVEAVERHQEQAWDLIFMDCLMPNMDGYEATPRIREHEQDVDHDTVVIALTANAMSTDVERCLNAGIDDHLAKPVSRAILSSMIQKYYPRPPASWHPRALRPNQTDSDAHLWKPAHSKTPRRAR